MKKVMCKSRQAFCWSKLFVACAIIMFSAQLDAAKEPVKPKEFRCISFSPCGTFFATTYGRSVRLYETQTGRLIKNLKSHIKRVRSVDFCLIPGLSNNKVIPYLFLLSASNDKTIKLWEVSNPKKPKLLKTSHGHANMIYAVTFSSIKGFFASCSRDRTIKLWDIKEDHFFSNLYPHSSRIRTIAFSPDGNILASGSTDKTIVLYNFETRESKILTGHEHSVYSVAFHPTKRILASGSRDNTIKLWNFTTGNCIRTFEGHSDDVRSVVFSRDGSFILSGSNDKTARVWDLQTGKCLAVLEHTDRVRAVAIRPPSKNRERVVVATASDCVKLWPLCFPQKIKPNYSDVTVCCEYSDADERKDNENENDRNSDEETTTVEIIDEVAKELHDLSLE